MHYHVHQCVPGLLRALQILKTDFEFFQGFPELLGTLCHRLFKTVIVGGEVQVFGNGLTVFHGPARTDQQLIHIERLLDIVKSPKLHGLHGGSYRRIRGQHNNGEIGLYRFGGFQQLYAIHWGHSNV